MGLGPFTFLLPGSALARSGAFCRLLSRRGLLRMRGRNSTHGSSNKRGTLGSRGTRAQR